MIFAGLFDFVAIRLGCKLGSFTIILYIVIVLYTEAKAEVK